MATKKGGKKKAAKKAAPKKAAEESSQEEIVRFRTFQQQPSTGAHKFLRQHAFKRNDEYFK